MATAAAPTPQWVDPAAVPPPAPPQAQGVSRRRECLFLLYFCLIICTIWLGYALTGRRSREFEIFGGIFSCILIAIFAWHYRSLAASRRQEREARLAQLNNMSDFMAARATRDLSPSFLDLEMLLLARGVPVQETLATYRRLRQHLQESSTALEQHAQGLSDAQLSGLASFCYPAQQPAEPAACAPLDSSSSATLAATASAAAVDSIESGHEQGNVSRLLDASSELPTAHSTETVQNSDGTSLSLCIVCLSEYSPGDVLTRLPCGHCYHQSCVTQWLQRHQDCPLCKQNVVELATRNG